MYALWHRAVHVFLARVLAKALNLLFSFFMKPLWKKIPDFTIFLVLIFWTILLIILNRFDHWKYSLILWNVFFIKFETQLNLLVDNVLFLTKWAFQPIWLPSQSGIQFGLPANLAFQPIWPSSQSGLSVILRSWFDKWTMSFKISIPIVFLDYFYFLFSCKKISWFSLIYLFLIIL